MRGDIKGVRGGGEVMLACCSVAIVCNMKMFEGKLQRRGGSFFFVVFYKSYAPFRVSILKHPNKGSIDRMHNALGTE